MRERSWDKLAGLTLVLFAHAAVLYAAWRAHRLPAAQNAPLVFVAVVEPVPRPERVAPPALQPPVPRDSAKARPEPRPQASPEPTPAPPPPPPPPPVAQAPSPPVLRAAPTPPAEAVAAAPMPQDAAPAPALPTMAGSAAPSPVPATAMAAPSAPLAPVPASPPSPPAGQVDLATELSVVCPHRAPPAYPALARRLGESGRVVLRVELDEAGRVVAARVETSSGHARLDEAALAAVRTWRCEPALRAGQPVRAVALQPFNFILEGR